MDKILSEKKLGDVSAPPKTPKGADVLLMSARWWTKQSNGMGYHQKTLCRILENS